ncbi:MAG: class I SAM-dependent methyltransferase [Alphaproteobacteria bacterium]
MTDTDTAVSSMITYYDLTERLPTFAKLETDDELSRYAAQRWRLFSELLGVSPHVFKGADVIEFGPDSGENALVFAQWGARLTLVEPNLKAHEFINAYLRRFGLTDRLAELSSLPIERYVPTRTFDAVVAEGFIFSVRPEALWMDLFARLLRPGGYAVISYYDRTSFGLEALWKLLFAALASMTGGRRSVELAWRLYATKWNSIRHTRAFESWVMDVLENPFIRLKYSLDAAEVVRQMAARGLSLSGSWPSYRDSLAVYWYKNETPPEARLARTRRFIDRNCLGHLFGTTMFLCGDEDEVAAVVRATREFVESIDAGYETPDVAGITRCARAIERLRLLVSRAHIYAEDPVARPGAAAMLDGVEQALRLILAGDTQGLVDLCNSDEALISHWGNPNHFAVFHKD